MATISICMPSATFTAIRRHLLSTDGGCEEAAFLFARWVTSSKENYLDVIDQRLVGPESFTHRSAFYLELTDDTRAFVIKRAHDLGAVLIEAHSHPGQRRACFSWSDLHGFDEFVPHVLWRLPKRPYAAIVFASNSVDALVWKPDDGQCSPVHALRAGSEIIRPTGLTIANWKDIYGRQTL